MKAKIIFPVVLLAVIAILSGALLYEVAQRQQDARNYRQFGIAFGMQLYQGLERGDAAAVKQRLGRYLAANSLLYEQQYGHEIGTKFAVRLAEADNIRSSFQTQNK